MPIFRVRRRVDAYVDYVTDVEAKSAADAAQIACCDEEHFDWEEEGACQFDARMFVALDSRGDEIDGTECGDL